MSEHALAADLDYILQNTQSVWKELKGQRLFITGGTGFVGTWLLEALIWANRELKLELSVTVLTRNTQEFAKKAPHLMREPALQFLTGDVRHFDFPKEHFSYVIYAATQASAKLNQEDPMLMVDTIVQGTRHVLDFSVAAKTRKFLFLSSGAIYGRQPPELSHLDENYSGAPDILNPNSAYGMGKGMAEHLCILHAKQYQQEVKIARCFAFVGPYLPIDTHFAIGNFIRDGLLNTDIKVKSDGSPYRSYQYAADLIIWLLKILTEGESCVPYNVGSDEAISIANVAQLVAKSFNDDLVVNIEKTAQKNTLSERYVPSVRRAQTALDLKSKIELPEAILKTIAWYRLHPERIGNN